MKFSRFTRAFVLSEFWNTRTKDERLILITILSLCDDSGHIESTIAGIANVARISLQSASKAIESLCGEDLKGDKIFIKKTSNGFKVEIIEDDKQVDIDNVTVKRLNKEDKITDKKSRNVNSEFLLFWDAYPGNRKTSKAECFHIFKAMCKNDTLPQIEILMSALDNWKKTDQWTSDGGAYICSPQKWLRQKMYTAEFKNKSETKNRKWMKEA